MMGGNIPERWLWGLFIAIALFSLAELLTAGIQQGFVSKLAPAHMRGNILLQQACVLQLVEC
ncbi:hypothetical protein ACFVSS_22240 [Peribacillus butanolivorans]|uniref:hypothetical protein n=1 Tax=Peribacillus butanolivorans TaxID=421767 RepID=UPI00366A915A